MVRRGSTVRVRQRALARLPHGCGVAGSAVVGRWVETPRDGNDLETGRRASETRRRFWASGAGVARPLSHRARRPRLHRSRRSRHRFPRAVRTLHHLIRARVDSREQGSSATRPDPASADGHVSTLSDDVCPDARDDLAVVGERRVTEPVIWLSVQTPPSPTSKKRGPPFTFVVATTRFDRGLIF